MLQEKTQRTYASIISDGTIRVPTDESNPKAILREYETSDGKKGTKHELVYKSLIGTIKYVNFYDGDFGKTLSIVIADDGEEDITLTLGVTTSFGSDMMKKLPNIDFSLPVTLNPYSFIDDKGKNKKGLTVIQNKQKVLNYFYDEATKGTLFDFPVPEKEYGKMDKDDWKIYFILVSKFLVNYTEKNIIPNFQTIDNEIAVYASPEEYVEAKKEKPAKQTAIKVENLPF